MAESMSSSPPSRPPVPFKPALLVVDMQEDFCPPHGSLAVSGGRAIVPLVNKLLAAPRLALRVATRDWHPPGHISFADNHPDKLPFVDKCTIVHPLNPSDDKQQYETTLWPVHCVQDTPGAQLVPELDQSRIDLVLDKGKNPHVEMYSAFYDPLRVSDSGLAKVLRERDITHVYVVGLAGDFCVRSTALDAHHEGFVTVVVEEGTRCVNPGGWEQCKAELAADGVRVVSENGDEVRWLYLRGGGFL